MEDCSPVVPLTRSNSPETTEFSDGVLAESIGTSDVQEWLDAAQEKILNWDSERSLTWDSEPVETSEFTQAVDEVRCLTESLEAALLKSPDPRARQIQDQASSILEVAMERLEEEFIRILTQHRLDITENVLRLHRHQERSCGLGFLLLGVQDQEVEPRNESFHPGLSPSERKLCDLIFGDYPGPASATCFSGISKGSLFQLLGFGEAIAISPPKPENLFGLLDMYEGLADLMPEIRDFFSPEGSPASISTECHEVLRRIGESVKASFNEFKNAIRKKTSNTPFPGGGPVHLTKYVMNYIGVIPKYRQTLCLLLEGQHDREEEEDGGGEVGSGDTSPLRRSLLSVAAILEENLRIRSKLYEDAALQHFFMMNNIHYMMKKVRECDIHELFGDDWMRAQSVQVHQHALHYQRESWSSVLNFFKDDGIYSPGSNQPSTAVLKERNLQDTDGMAHPDDRLRDDVVISISLNILQAYRNFKGRYEAYLTGQRRREKYIKFTVDDLQNYLLDFFLGSPKALHLPRRA
ncbi:unnamed protein product [Spirodela intermedia]|uniref:Exocyst subunit Exo70 family protein n=1 Tax=Spirodela intermedia TaxID=51605 RepID=A0A7I8IHM7_SPIIN|nr:unnamed protein product [Spirodela intermedia]CAA6657381.1 unnamed protein product [Spirodela intermedia]